MDAEKILGHLDENQRRVVIHRDGPLLVIAGAGSGKTSTIVGRVIYLTKVHGICADRVMALTFTRKASLEMSARLERAMPDERPCVYTFHALCRKIMAEEFPGFMNWEGDMFKAEKKYKRLLKEACDYRKRGVSLSPGDLAALVDIAKSYGCGPNDEQTMMIARQIHEANPGSMNRPNKLIEAFLEAEEMREAARIFTFADWMIEVVSMFDSKPEIKEKWAAKWDYIIQDECQDQSEIQYRLVNHLAKGHGNYMAVGDVSQSIYGFRGAVPDSLMTFSREWNAGIVQLPNNYRSSEEIVKHANSLVSAGIRGGVIMKSIRGNMKPVIGRACMNRDEEGDFAAIQALELHESGVPWKSMAVLYRTHSLSRAFESAFSRSKIPYVVVGASPFYEREQCKALISYLRLASRKYKFEHLESSLRSPFRYLSNQFLSFLKKEIMTAEPGKSLHDVVAAAAVSANAHRSSAANAAQWADLIQKIRSMYEQKATAEAILRQVIVDTRYYEWLKKEYGDNEDDDDRSADVAALVSAAGRFSSIDEFLEHVDEPKSIDKKGADVVTLSTIHSAKGLEWPIVFLAGCNDGILPHSRAISESDIEEERRIFYVAITRARDALFALWSLNDGQKLCDPSPFLDQAGIAALDLDEDWEIKDQRGGFELVEEEGVVYAPHCYVMEPHE